MITKKPTFTFKKIYIEITNACNLSCSFCPLSKREVAYMTVEDFEKILNQIEGYSNYLYLHVKGEPLLHPNLDQILRLCYKKGFKVNLVTNGTMINQMKDILLNNPSLRQISFSLQSFEDHLKIREKEKYIKNIIDFTRSAKDKTNLIIEYRIWNLEKNDINNPTKKNHCIFNALEGSLNLPFKIEEIINLGKGIKLAKNIYLSQSYEFDWPDMNRDIISDKGFCYGLRNQIAILVDGTVIPCCLDSEGDINLGNIYDEAFKDIIESERVENIIRGFSNREVVEPLCMRCGYRTRFDL